MTEGNDITRREAIARTALLVGGTLTAAHLAGAESPAWAAAAGPHWHARTLTSPQSELVATIAEHILPATDTPGARAAGVDRFVDVILTDYYKSAERDRFLAGLADVDARSQKKNGKAFLASTPAQQMALLRTMDGESFPPERVLAKAEPLNTERAKMRDSLARQSSTSTTISDPTRPSADAGANETARRELEQGWFFRRMKELTLLGYYTSQAGAMKELTVNPMGIYRADIPYRSVGHSWA